MKSMGIFHVETLLDHGLESTCGMHLFVLMVPVAFQYIDGGGGKSFKQKDIVKDCVSFLDGPPF